MPLYCTGCSDTKPDWWFLCLGSWTKQGTDPHSSAPLPGSSRSPCHKCHTHTKMQHCIKAPENSKLVYSSEVHFKKKKIFTCIFQGTKENASSHMVGGGFPTHKLFSGSYKAKYRFPGRKSIAQNQYVQNSLHTSIRYWALQAANTPAGQAAGTLMTKMLVQLCSLQAEQLWQVFGLCFFIKSYSGLGQIRQIGEVELPHLVLEAAKPEVKGFWPHGWVLLEY